ncbi:hypothetical protein JTB14_009967 [Gonioctena quinquepunctata]|nr:hypothetical protein JTB14_009967 [Gonioctena quinquepunctata]
MEAIETNKILMSALEKVIAENPNTHRRIEEITTKMRNNTNMFQRNLVKKWLEENRYLPVEKVMINADIQADFKPRVAEMGTQIYPWNLGSDPIDWIVHTTDFGDF